ncbi:MAG: hypothetical protein ACPGYP_00235 [Solirubrobacterales bacterium]
MTSLLPYFGSLLAAAEAPAGGAAAQEVMIATLMGGFVFSGVVVLALMHRAGRITWLQSLGEFAGRQANLPAWAALPLTVLTVSLLAAVFGLYWDISLHLSKGRDEGPLANPSHYFILIGLLGVFSAGVLAMSMPKPGTKPSPWSVKLSDNWYAPVGGILIALSAAFGLVGFPLDDLWHRMFGQDVTLWGPTHLLMLAGAGLTVIGASVLLTEGSWARNQQRGNKPEQTQQRIITKLRKAAAAGGLLAALSIFQGEFDFGIAQFQLVFHPLMIMVAAGLALTYARIWLGKGGALMAAIFFVVIRSALTLIVAGGLDRPVAHFPLYIGPAIAVELVGLLMAGSVRSKPMTFALVAGAAVGTFGLAAEWAWSFIWMPYSWPASLLPEGAIVGFVAAISGAFIGAWMANSLGLRPPIKGVARWAPITGVLLIALMTAYGLRQTEPPNVVASITTEQVETGKPGKWVLATAKLNTTYFDSDNKWAKSIAWQGPGFEVEDLEKIGPGTYRTAEPMPAFGKWKSMIRFHKGDTLMGVPIFEPRDDAIPAAEVPALPQMERQLLADREILQRESTVDGSATAYAGYFGMLLIALLLLGALGWGIWRISQPLTDDQMDDGSAGADGERTQRAAPKPTATPSTT